MKFIDTILDFGSEHSTQILSAFAIGGAILLPVLASRATLKAKKEIDKETWKAFEEATSEYHSTPETPDEDKDALKDDILDKHGLVRKTVGDKSDIELKPWNKVKIGFKYYIPTAICVGVTVACVAGCEKVHLGRELELGTLVSFWEQRYLRLDEFTRKEFGEDAVKKVKSDADKYYAQNTKAEHSPEEIQSVRNEKFWVWDDIAKEHVKTCVNDMSAAICMLNQQFASVYSYGRVTWNDFRRFLGLRPCKNGDKWAWDQSNEELTEWMAYNGDMWLDLKLGGPEGVDTKDSEMAYTFCFNYPPYEDGKARN